MIRLSLVIPAKDRNDPKLADLLRSLDSQDFPKDQMEVLIITEGTSESAKAIGIKKAKGEVIGILASDNVLSGAPDFLHAIYSEASYYGAAYPAFYRCREEFDILTRYFALIGGNDPLAFYMGKNDRLPHYAKYRRFCSCNKTIGDNGFFIRKDFIEKTDLDNYYHIDNAVESNLCPYPLALYITHNTGGNIFSFLRKRYRYGLQHAFNKNRRWHLVDFRKPRDIVRLIWFILCGLTLVQPLILSLKGYMKIRDAAWFIHWPVCMATLITYGLLIIYLGLRKLSQSSSAPMAVQRA